MRSRASLSSQFSRCFTAHNKWSWCHEAHSLNSLNKVWETEIKTFFALLTQSDHQRVYPGGVNGRISENLWENTKKWRAADSSDGQNKQIDRELRRDLKRAIKQLCVTSWAFLFGYHLKNSLHRYSQLFQLVSKSQKVTQSVSDLLYPPRHHWPLPGSGAHCS